MSVHPVESTIYHHFLQTFHGFSTQKVVKKEVIYDIKDNSINTVTDKSEDENEVTNCSDIFSQETQEVSEIDVSEVTDSSDILPQKTEEVSQKDGGEVTNSSDIWPQKTQKCSEKDGSEVTVSSNILPQKTKTISNLNRSLAVSATIAPSSIFKSPETNAMSTIGTTAFELSRKYFKLGKTYFWKRSLNT